MANTYEKVGNNLKVTEPTTKVTVVSVASLLEQKRYLQAKIAEIDVHLAEADKLGLKEAV